MYWKRLRNNYTKVNFKMKTTKKRQNEPLLWQWWWLGKTETEEIHPWNISITSWTSKDTISGSTRQQQKEHNQQQPKHQRQQQRQVTWVLYSTHADTLTHSYSHYLIHNHTNLHGNPFSFRKKKMDLKQLEKAKYQQINITNCKFIYNCNTHTHTHRHRHRHIFVAN